MKNTKNANRVKGWEDIVFKFAPAAVFTVDKNRCVRSWNKKAEEITGYAADEVIGKECYIFAEAPCNEKCGLYSVDVTKPIINRECAIRRKDNQTRIIAKSSDLLKDDVGNIIGGIEVFEDITDRKNIQEQLEASAQRFKNLIESTSDWVWEVDKDGVYTYVSPKIKDLLGYEPDEVVGKTPFDFIVEDDMERVSEFFKKKVISKEPFFNLENTNRHKDGHLVVLETNGVPFFDENGQLKGYRGVDRDITERKKVQEALKNSEERLKILFEYAPDAYFLHDLQGVFVDGNKTAEELIGFKKEELIGRSFLKLNILPPTQLLKATALLSMSALGQPTGPDEFILIAKDGRRLVVEIRTFPVRIKGKILILDIAHDITRRKNTEEKLKTAYRKLRALKIRARKKNKI
jgi:PAS domain S-box-containing protein